MKEEDRQLIRDISRAVQTLLEKAEEFNNDVNHQSPFDITDVRLCYIETKEALDEVDRLLKLLAFPSLE